jgi:hypothetical protein
MPLALGEQRILQAGVADLPKPTGGRFARTWAGMAISQRPRGAACPFVVAVVRDVTPARGLGCDTAFAASVATRLRGLGGDTPS